ncbi:MAG: LamG domain-containing protein, partial [Elusimicrobiota bacterium]
MVKIKIIFLATMFLMLGLFSSYDVKAVTDEDLIEGIEAYWSFDNDSTIATAVIDSTPNGNDGSIHGATCGVEGQINESCDFDGSNDYINTLISDLGDEFSVSLWVNADSWTDYPIGNNDQKDNGEFYIRTLSGLIQFNMQGNIQYSVNSETGYTAGNWYHIVLTFDGTTMRGYEGGVEIITPTTISGWSGTDDTPIQISRNLRDCSFWNGRIDEPAIWNRALTSDEVLE